MEPTEKDLEKCNTECDTKRPSFFKRLRRSFTSVFRRRAARRRNKSESIVRSTLETSPNIEEVADLSSSLVNGHPPDTVDEADETSDSILPIENNFRPPAKVPLFINDFTNELKQSLKLRSRKIEEGDKSPTDAIQQIENFRTLSSISYDDKSDSKIEIETRTFEEKLALFESQISGGSESYHDTLKRGKSENVGSVGENKDYGSCDENDVDNELEDKDVVNKNKGNLIIEDKNDIDVDTGMDIGEEKECKYVDKERDVEEERECKNVYMERDVEEKRECKNVDKERDVEEESECKNVDKERDVEEKRECKNVDKERDVEEERECKNVDMERDVEEERECKNVGKERHVEEEKECENVDKERDVEEERKCENVDMERDLETGKDERDYAKDGISIGHGNERAKNEIDYQKEDNYKKKILTMEGTGIDIEDSEEVKYTTGVTVTDFEEKYVIERNVTDDVEERVEKGKGEMLPMTNGKVEDLQAHAKRVDVVSESTEMTDDQSRQAVAADQITADRH